MLAAVRVVREPVVVGLRLVVVRFVVLGSVPGVLVAMVRLSTQIGLMRVSALS